MTVRDVILTITLMLGAGLASQLVADYLRLPRMLVLLIRGHFGPVGISASAEFKRWAEANDVPFRFSSYV